MPENPAARKVRLRAALAECDQAQQWAEEQAARAQQQGKRAEDLYLQNLRLQRELERYKKWYYGPGADRLKSAGELGQVLLAFGEELAQKPVSVEETAAACEPAGELRRVKRRRGRRALARFENLPVTTQIYELSAEERACPCCGEEHKEIGAEESWQIEYFPGHCERLQHVRKKYTCAHCEAGGKRPCTAGWPNDSPRVIDEPLLDSTKSLVAPKSYRCWRGRRGSNPC